MDRQTGQSSERRRASLSRREALRYGLIGAGGLLCAGGAGYWLLRAADPAGADVAEVFKGDAPAGQLWEQWNARGWVVEARNYLALGGNVQCKNCPNECLLAPGDRGRCRNKVNKDGTLYTLAYANPCVVHLDPIEKKPLYHFLPGTTVLSLATTGCGFRCLNCQNWDISQRKPEELKDPRGNPVRLTADNLSAQDIDRVSMFPKDVAGVARVLKSPSVACTYSEPTSWYEYAFDIAKASRQEGIKSVWVTCGYIQEKPLVDLCRYLDAAQVDIKSFSEQTYRQLNSGKLWPVLNTIRTMKKMGVWVEVSYLVVPSYADNMDGIRRLCDWLLKNLGPHHPLHFLRFHAAHRLTNLPPTPLETMLQARRIAQSAGLHYVYLGNVRDVQDSDTTICPGCKRPVILRDGFALRQMNLADGKCSACGFQIAGVWHT